MKYKILVVDDDRDNLDSTKMLLELHGYLVKTVSGGRQALDLIRKNHEYALILMDYHMPDMNGANVITEIKKLKPQQQILAYSMDNSRDTAVETFRAGAADFIEKSADNEVLLKTIRAYCDKYETVFRTISKESLDDSEENDLLKKMNWVGKSNAIYKLAEDVQKYALVSSTVLILGETGTGKELVAQAIHKNSPRANNKFVAVNCGAIPQGLVESTLFGHVKGAFTGALHDQDGKFKLAHSGTIFLDEIGELPMEAQVKLLRVLQEKTVDPVGSRNGTKVDVRVIAATHKNLEAMVKEGTFREDLLYRLNTLILKTPPLRDRPEDIEPLIENFTRKVWQETGFQKYFQRATLQHLKQYKWPGNVRELQSMVESHLIRCPGDMVTIDQLDTKFFMKDEIPSANLTLQEIENRLEQMKFNYVMETINNSLNKQEAARKLNISPTSLQYILSKMSKEKTNSKDSLLSVV